MRLGVDLWYLLTENYILSFYLRISFNCLSHTVVSDHISRYFHISLMHLNYNIRICENFWCYFIIL